MKRKGNIIYGTLQECVDELWKEIDFENVFFPDFDYAAVVYEDASSVQEAYDGAEGWFGVKDLRRQFDCDTISVLFGHYGGGGIESMEIVGEDETEKETFIQRIGVSTDSVGYGVLNPDDPTVFEIRRERRNHHG